MLKEIIKGKLIRNLLMVLFVLVWSGCKDDIIQRKQDYASVFQSFWEIMDTEYVFFEEKGVDWDIVYKEYMPRFKKASSDSEAVSFFQEILNQLHDGHVWIKTGDSLIQHEEAQEELPMLFYKIYTRYNLQQFKEYPYIHVGQVNNSITYLRVLEGIEGDALEGVDIENYSFDNGLIIDLRECLGGYASGVNTIGNFVETKESAFYIQYKKGSGHRDFTQLYTEHVTGNGRIPSTIPMVVLINKNAFSTGNLLASILKDIRKSTIVGEQSGGGAGSVISVFLPNGWGLTYPENRIYNLSSELIEDGIEPDIEVPVAYDFWNGEHQETGEDPQLEKALEILMAL